MADTPENTPQTQPETHNAAPAAAPVAKPTNVLGLTAVGLSAVALCLAALPYAGVGIGPQVRSYLLKNPQVLDEVVAARQQMEDQNVTSSIDQNAAKNPALLAHDARDPAIGPENAKVTVIQFFDYRCPGCKAVSADYIELIKRHPEVRFVFKEWPILDNGSTVTSNYAARAALAANKQGKYMAVHNALMAERGLTPQIVDDILKENGVDMAAARAFINSPDAVRHLTDIQAISMALQLRGTPTFFVNGKTSASIDPAEVEKMIQAAK